MSKMKIDKEYVSVIDKFLQQAEHTNRKTPSQNREIRKHQRIFESRDNKHSDESHTEIWEEF